MSSYRRLLAAQLLCQRSLITVELLTGLSSRRAIVSCTMFRIARLSAALLLIAIVPASAQAYWPYSGYGFGYPWGNGYFNGYNYGYDYVPAPPYFSIYPPVYYSSQITARHYGASPFAWPSVSEPITYVSQPEAAEAPQPLLIENPYVKGAKRADATRDNREVQPVKIENPYVARAER